jgi:UDP-N-acetylglucosamine/UDP-N-acetylgalactosamine 4-epimerase
MAQECHFGRLPEILRKAVHETLMNNKKFHKDPLENLSFLVTGGAGFIGSHIVEYLLKNNAKLVKVMDNLSTGSVENVDLFRANKSYEFIKADICDPAACAKACNGIDFVFHEAAIGSVPRSIADPLTTHQSNINGFLNMLIAAKDNEVKRFVYASSSSVFGDSMALPKTEEQLGNPLSPYAVTKRVNELYAHVFSGVYGMEIIGLRYFNIFGPRQSPDGPYAAAIPLFIDALIADRPVRIFGDGEQSRDFTFVENAVQANVLAMFTENLAAIGEVFNIAVGEQITVNELFRILSGHAGKTGEVIHDEERAGDVRHSMADISKAKKYLGYKPEVGAKEGLHLTFDWFKNGMIRYGKNPK